MGIHDRYVKRLFREIADNSYSNNRNRTAVDYGDITAYIDGVFNNCAIEIESRTDKQIRGAILDLVNHEYNNKLLVIVPANMNNSQRTKEHCIKILNDLCRDGHKYQVALLKGTGIKEEAEIDKEIIRSKLSELEVL